MPEFKPLEDGHLITVKSKTRVIIPFEYTWAPLFLEVRASSLINVIMVRNGESARVTAENAAEIGAMIFPQVPSMSHYIRQLPGSWSLDTGWKLIFENLSNDAVAVNYSIRETWE